MEFKKLSDVEVIAEPTESANVLIEENGVIKKAPKTAVGGGSGNIVVITLPEVIEMDVDASDIISGATCNKTFDEVLEMYSSRTLDYAFLRMDTDYQMTFSRYINYIQLWDVSGNALSYADTSSVECIEFRFNTTTIYYYRNGLSYTGTNAPA